MVYDNNVTAIVGYGVTHPWRIQKPWQKVAAISIKHLYVGGTCMASIICGIFCNTNDLFCSKFIYILFSDVCMLFCSVVRFRLSLVISFHLSDYKCDCSSAMDIEFDRFERVTDRIKYILFSFFLSFSYRIGFWFRRTFLHIDFCETNLFEWKIFNLYIWIHWILGKINDVNIVPCYASNTLQCK